MMKKLFLSLLLTLPFVAHAALNKRDVAQLNHYVLSKEHGEHNLNPEELYHALNSASEQNQINTLHKTDYFKDKNKSLSTLIQFLFKQIGAKNLTPSGKFISGAGPQLFSCNCIGIPQRVYNALIMTLQTIHTCEQKDSLSYISLGSGYLLQDSLYLSALSKLGIKNENIYIYLIDTLYESQYTAANVQKSLEKLKKDTGYTKIIPIPSSKDFEESLLEDTKNTNIVFALADPPNGNHGIVKVFNTLQATLEKTAKQNKKQSIVSLMANQKEAGAILFKLTTNAKITIDETLSCQACPLAKPINPKAVAIQAASAAAPATTPLSQEKKEELLNLILTEQRTKEDVLKNRNPSQRTELEEFLKELGL